MFVPVTRIFHLRFVRLDGVVLSISTTAARKDAKNFPINASCRIVRRRLKKKFDSREKSESADAADSDSSAKGDSTGKWQFSVETYADVNIFAAASSHDRYLIFIPAFRIFIFSCQSIRKSRRFNLSLSLSRSLEARTGWQR